MKSLIIISLTNLIFFCSSVSGNNLQVSSPDETIQVTIRLTDKVYYNLSVDNEEVMWYSPISIVTEEAGWLGRNPKLLKSKVTSTDNIINPVWGIRKEIPEKYNELKLDFEGGYSLIFRVYDDGIAYRFRTDINGELTIKNEEVEYRFLKDFDIVAHVVENYQTSFEELYTKMKISEIAEESLSSLPFIVDNGKIKLAITESDLFSYPGMYLSKPGNTNMFYLNGTFAAYPKTWEMGGWCQFELKVTERLDYIAKVEGKRNFPWRTIIVARTDIELVDNNMVYKLARPAEFDGSWIKPGKVTWEWWNAWNLEGVDFETGINNKTYKYYIDFASENGIEYLIMDEGWSDQFDVLLPTPMIDMEHITNYAESKGVKIIMWVVWHTIDRQMDKAFTLFEKWGIAGVKVDFIDRDDQLAIEFYERLAKEAAKHHLLVNFHGCSKPTGLHRTYPNVINFEAVRGNEYNKFSENETPDHNVDVVYIRMIAGPMDYTPGAMRNSILGDFKISYLNPMSYGTLCHQIGMFVVYFAPLQMLCDAPTAYENQPDILNFITEVPVNWDETKALEGKFGEYVVIARKSGSDWYIGGLNNWNERNLELDLSFLDTGTWEAEILSDGINANRVASDHQYIKKKIKSADKLKITMKNGGGFAIKLERMSE